jgi:hypothetical protein
MIIQQDTNSGLSLVRLEERDFEIYSQMFSQAPYLSMNKGNYQSYFRNPNVEVNALVENGNLVSLLGTERNFEMESSTSGETRKDICSYLFSGYSAPIRRKAGRITDLIDYNLKSRPNETFGARLIGDGKIPYSIKPGNENLARVLEARGFEVVGYKPSHGGRVYLKKGNK